MEAIERIVKESGQDSDMVPDYVSLLGTIRACREQTAAFRWTLLFESVECRIQDALKNLESKGAQRRNKNTSKRRKLDGPTTVNPESVTFRVLPFPVLQSLLMWLRSLQSFPEHRLLHLRCDSGISTAVVWCHHILGLTVTVSLQACDVKFGDGVSNVHIEMNGSMRAGASLMDPMDQNEPLFTLADEEDNPKLYFEIRAEAYGYGLTILKRHNLAEKDICYCSNWVIAQALLMVSVTLDKSKVTASAQPDTDEPCFEHRNPSRAQVFSAGRFMFAMEGLDTEFLAERALSQPQSKAPFMRRIDWRGLVAILIVFARVRGEDLKKCSHLPLSLSEHPNLKQSNLGIERASTASGVPPALDLINSFQILSRLLLGHSYSQDYVGSAVLVSAWGWSIFLESVDARDPVDVSVSTMRVLHGVPSRRGLRRTRIIDGPTELQMSFSKGETLSRDPQITYFPGVSTAKKGLILVGHYSDAFQITQTFDWKSRGIADKKHKLGFRELQVLCCRFDRLPPCQHNLAQIEFPSWIDVPAQREKFQDSVGIRYVSKWPQESAAKSKNEDNSQSTSAERVVAQYQFPIRQIDEPYHEIWYFHVSDNPAARWLQLDDICNSCEVEEFSFLAMRGKETCLDCAMRSRLAPGQQRGMILL